MFAVRPPLTELVELLHACAPTDGIHATSFPGVCAVRMSGPGEELVRTLHHPAVCLIAQGAKRVMLRDELFTYDPSRVLVFSVDLPISAQVMEASPARPYLCFRLDIDPVQVADLVMHGAPATRSAGEVKRGLYVRQFGTSPVRDIERLKQGGRSAIPG